MIFLLGNYHESLNDAKAAVDLQPTFIKAIARGNVILLTSQNCPEVVGNTKRTHDVL